MNEKKLELILEYQNNESRIFSTDYIYKEVNQELNIIGLSIDKVLYYTNEDCDHHEERQCGCPYFLKIKIVNIYKRIYEPDIWFFIFNINDGYKLRFIDENGFSCVKDNFWIKDEKREQKSGKYIHSNDLKQIANDIKIAHQAAEIKNYQSIQFDEFYSQLFKKV